MGDADGGVHRNDLADSDPFLLHAEDVYSGHRRNGNEGVRGDSSAVNEKDTIR